ncbi:hypothetical protein KC19_11G011200 [Ceratodon purpureus]|uniref:STAS domain-containing protein n=1 Tax=Ceratodon purpureus TaxID=3225 RepID=A0A8T0GFE4_CERPU|nr:hypothetical protein KC19_11G011200 [Ceratodon purpureus]
MTGIESKNYSSMTEGKRLVHQVVVPPKDSFAIETGRVVRETFFHDVGPLDWFKGVSRRQQCLLALKYAFPIVDWLSTYKLNTFLYDLLAGVTTASVAIPQDLGYASLLGIPAVYGLYTSVVPPLVYAVFGTSRNTSIGIVAGVTLLLGEMLKREISPTADAANYLRLAFTATFFAGVFQAGLGILRLGFITEFLSHASIVGFMAGAAFIISLQQLRGLFNIAPAHFSRHTDLVSVVRSVLDHTDEWNWRTIVMGIAFFAFLSMTKFLAKKKPRLFWVAAIAPLVSVIISTALVFLTRADKHGVMIVGYVKKGMNPSSAHQIFFSGPFMYSAVKIGLVTGLVALTEGLAIGRTFATLCDYRMDGNKEMMSFGFMNIFGSLFSCFVSTGMFSRSALSYNAGGLTPMSNIVMAIIVAITLSVLTPLIYYTPSCILSAVVISAVLTIIDLKALWLIWKVDTLDFLTSLGAFFGTLFVSIEIGLLTAVCISFVKILFNITRPHTAILGKIPGTTVYRNMAQYLKATSVPGILAIRIDSAVYFSNSAYIHDKILVYLEKEKQRLGKIDGPKVCYLVIDLTPVTNIDTNGVIAFERIEKAMKKHGIQLAFANPGTSVLRKLDNSDFLARLGSEWVFMTVGEAIQVCSILMNHQDA